MSEHSEGELSRQVCEMLLWHGGRGVSGEELCQGLRSPVTTQGSVTPRLPQRGDPAASSGLSCPLSRV